MNYEASQELGIASIVLDFGKVRLIEMPGCLVAGQQTSEDKREVNKLLLAEAEM